MPKHLRKAFSMLELIFVIIILGIVSSIGADIIANVYEGYIIQRAQHRASIKTELAALQIANRLAYAIPGTVVRKNGTAVGGTDINELGNATDTTLQWVGADADSFKAINNGAGANRRRPGWNGFCDVDASGDTNISTPGSNLNLATTIIGNLSKDAGGANLRTLANTRIYFPLKTGLRGYDVASGVGEIITLDPPDPLDPPVKIAEHYKLAWSSYALVTVGNNLWLHYNFAPTRGVVVPNNFRRLLLRNVTTFEFRGDGRTIRFKLCAQEDIGADFNVTICKEKAVF